jgi:hypothetical protein
LILCLSVLIPLVVALAISVEMPAPSIRSVIEVLLLMAGLIGVIALVISTRYTVTLTLLALYLGLLDGPVKLEAADKFASGVRDVLIVAIGLGMLMRLPLKRERVLLPPLSAWVFAFVAITLVEAFNPDTNGILKVLGGYRQQLEFVPLFFFGYMVIRSKQRFRQLFLVLGVIALANGLVGTYQSRLSPSQLSGWGPGYGERIAGNGKGQGGRTYAVEGVAHNRPPALGSDSGFGGAVGTLAVPGLLALLAVGRLRRRWPVLLCMMGALLGVATSASRTDIVVALVALATFAGLAVVARLRVGRALGALMIVAALGGVTAAALVAVDGSQIFHRQEALVKLAGGEDTNGHETGDDGKEKHLNEIPRDIADAPFGFGLGTIGAVAGLGGHERVTVENEIVGGGSAYNLLVVEVGAPGLIAWLGISLSVIVLGVTRMRGIVDPELRIYLVALLTAFIAFTIQGISAPTLAVTPAGAYLWFAPGVFAYWFLGPGRTAFARKPELARPEVARPAGAVAA